MLFIISILITMLVVVITVHSRFETRMIEEYTRMAKGATQLMADRIDGDEFVVILRGEDYKNRVQHLSDVKESFDKDYDEYAEPWDK